MHCCIWDAKWCSAQNAICRSKMRKFASNRNAYRALSSFLFQRFHHLQCWLLLAFFIIIFIFLVFAWWLFGLRFCLMFNVFTVFLKRNVVVDDVANMCTVIDIHPQRQNKKFFFLSLCSKEKMSIIRHQIQTRLRR